MMQHDVVGEALWYGERCIQLHAVPRNSRGPLVTHSRPKVGTYHHISTVDVLHHGSSVVKVPSFV
jgi:hypothetical protein